MVGELALPGGFGFWMRSGGVTGLGNRSVVGLKAGCDRRWWGIGWSETHFEVQRMGCWPGPLLRMPVPFLGCQNRVTLAASRLENFGLRSEIGIRL